MADDTDNGWSSGFVCGLLTSRYYALRYQVSDAIFQTAAPNEVPDVVRALIKQMPGVCVDQRLYETGWSSLDHLLLCDSVEELKGALILTTDRSLQ